MARKKRNEKSFALAKSAPNVNSSKRVNSSHLKEEKVTNAESKVNGMLGLQIQEHPLLNDVILETLFQFVHPKDLPACRLVCYTWRQNSVKAFRSTRSMKLSPLSSEGNLAIGKYIDLWKTESVSKRFQQFTLAGWELLPLEGHKPITRSDRSKLTNFWEIVGPTITWLKLTGCRSERPDILLQLINEGCPKLETLILEDSRFGRRVPWLEEDGDQEVAVSYVRPRYGEHANLKSLKICTSGEKKEGVFRRFWNFNFGIPWNHFLPHFPNLTYLNIGENVDMICILNTIREIRLNGADKMQLDELKIDHPIYLYIPIFNRIADLIIELQIPVTSWTINLPSHNNDAIRNALQTSRSVLKDLSIYTNHLNTTPIRCEFLYELQWDKLSNLNMSGNIECNLKLLKYCPNLEKLMIRRDCSVILPTELEMGDVKALKLTDLTLLKRFTQYQIRCIASWIPNVEKIRMSFNDVMFRVACETWKELIQVTVLGVGDTYLTDEGITGIRLKTKSGKSEKSVMRPDITNLQKLEWFFSPNSRLTDASVFNGFLQLARLRNLILPCSRFSKEAKNALRKNGVKLSA